MRQFLPVLLLAGCGAQGAMRQASMTGRCAEGDAACSRKNPQAPIAIGTRFFPDISGAIDGSTTPNLRIESAVPDIVAVDADGSLVAKKPGASAILITTDDGSVVDFIHVWVSPITKITLARRDGDRIASSIGLAVGEDLTLQPTLWFGAQRLSGDGDVQWSSSNEQVLTILRDGSPDRRRIRARMPGKTTLTIGLQTNHGGLQTDHGGLQTNHGGLQTNHGGLAEATTTVDVEVVQ